MIWKTILFFGFIIFLGVLDLVLMNKKENKKPDSQELLDKSESS